MDIVFVVIDRDTVVSASTDIFIAVNRFYFSSLLCKVEVHKGGNVVEVIGNSMTLNQEKLHEKLIKYVPNEI
jgi:hypothetical protein